MLEYRRRKAIIAVIARAKPVAILGKCRQEPTAMRLPRRISDEILLAMTALLDGTVPASVLPASGGYYPFLHPGTVTGI